MPILPQFDGVLALINCAFEGIALWEADPCRIVYANPAFWRLIGVPARAREGILSWDDVQPGLQAQMADLLDRFRDQGTEASTVSTCLDVGIGHKSVEIRLCQATHDNKRLVGMIAREFIDESNLKRDSNDTARHDPLTGLPDREFLMSRLATLLEGERSADRQFAVIFLDLDNFKQVNDEFGHLIGDNVLREAARRIAACLREGDHAVRFGGDEFVAFIEGVTAMHEVVPVIARIHTALSTPIAIPGGEVFLSLSAGVAVASETCLSAEELLVAADRAMYASKRNSSQTVAGVFDPGTNRAP
jgi:diguanylate cyclase (GGDEF)-like protein